MAARTIRCGRCRYEFIIGGVNETTCPQCGARNRVPGMATTEGPVVDTTAPEDESPQPAAPTGPTWVVCPSCSYRFAVGDVESVRCPLCATDVGVS